MSAQVGVEKGGKTKGRSLPANVVLNQEPILIEPAVSADLVYAACTYSRKRH
jgi:hypothetical protein